MRLLRDRRKRGFRCVTIEVGGDDVAGLVTRGLLDRLHRDDPRAVHEALGKWLDQLAAPRFEALSTTDPRYLAAQPR